MDNNELEQKYAAAISLLAKWCHAVHSRGTGWDNWDEYYKTAAYRQGILRHDINYEIAKLVADEEAKKNEYLKYI